MVILVSLVIALSTHAAAQGLIGFSGRWTTEDVRMHAGGEAVASALGAERLPRVPRQARARELVIEEQPEAVAVGRMATTLLSLPLSGVAVTTKDPSGVAVTARAVREGLALVIRREHQVRLPGGSAVRSAVEERHDLLADGTLLVTTTSTSGVLVETTRAIYTRAQ